MLEIISSKIREEKKLIKPLMVLNISGTSFVCLQKIYIFKSCAWKSIQILYSLLGVDLSLFCMLESKVHTTPQAQKNFDY